MSNMHDTPVWHLATDRERVGPLSAGEVRERYLAGELGERPQVWREGLAGWAPLNSVSGFEDLVVSMTPAEKHEREVSSHFDCLQRIAGSVWSEAETLGDYLAKQAVEDVGENTAMVDIRRISSTYAAAAESRSGEFAAGSVDGLAMVPRVLFTPEPEVNPVNRALVVVATVMTITTSVLAAMLLV